MNHHRTIARNASLTAAGAALALGLGALAVGPAQAETTPAQDNDAQKISSVSLNQAALVRSEKEPTVYYLKVPNPNGLGEVPAPDGKYNVDIRSGAQHEHFVVQSKDGTLNMKDSHILKTAKFEPQVSVNWAG